MDKDTIILALLVVCFVLHLLPRLYVRRFRYHLSRFVYWQWRKMSKLSAVVYSWLYERFNGKNGD